jgi:sigma-E factor negative regulatory protein RseC
MTEKIITHPGYVKTINESTAEVVIISKSGCSSCDIKASCGVSEMEEKIIDVELNDDQNFHAGDKVQVEMKQSQGTWAVLLGYVFPFVVVVISLIILTSLGIDQGISGLISLLLLLPYYLVVYYSKDILKKNFRYRISPSA